VCIWDRRGALNLRGGCVHKYRGEELCFDLGVEQKFFCLDTRLGGLGIL
jgi:hypothetical protein